MFFFLTLQQRLHPGDPVLTSTAPGLPTALDHWLLACLQGDMGHQEVKQARGGKGHGAGAIWEKGWDWMGHQHKEQGQTGETGVHFCVDAARSACQGLAPPHASSFLASLCLPLTSDFVIATWGPAGGVLP